MNKVQLIVESDLSQVDTAFTKNQKVINDTNEEAQQFGRVVKQSANIATKEMSQFEKETKDGTRQVRELNKAAVAVGKEGSKGVQQLSTATRKYTTDAKAATQETGNLNKGLDGITGAIGAAFSVGAVSAFVGKIVSTRAEFQKFEAVLTNTLGSKSQAQNALMMIQDVAAKTPFSVQELTASFVKLANQGFKPTAAEITKLGDLAASQGKTFDQLTEGIIDAQTGEFERLKEFGIKAKKEGDNVKFSFKGVETQVKNNGKAINDYILGLGELEGVSGGMAAISDTLGGKISNLGDNFDAFFNNLGESSEGVFSSILDGFNNFLSQANDAQKALNQITRNLKGSGAEIGFFEGLGGGAQGVLLPLQNALNKINDFTQTIKSPEGFIVVTKTLDKAQASLNDQYKQGSIDIVDYTRKSALLKQARQSTLDTAAAFTADQEKENERVKKEAADAAKIANEKLKKKKEDDAKLRDQTLKHFDDVNEDANKELENENKRLEDVNKANIKAAEDQAKSDEEYNKREQDRAEEHQAELKKTREQGEKDRLAEEQRLYDALDKAGDAVLNLLSQQANRAVEESQKEIDASKEKQAELLRERDTLNGKLSEEQKLKDDGFANDTARVEAEIARKDAEVAAEKKREAELIEERKKAAKIKLVIDSATQGSNILTAGSTLFAEGAFKGPAGIIAASATILGMLAAFFALKAQIKAQSEGFAKGGYTGDGGKYEVAGDVHRGEYVITKEKTAKNRALLEGMHTDNPVLIRKGIFELLNNTGVSLPDSKNITHKRALINEATTARQQAGAINLANVERELSEIKGQLAEIVKSRGDDTYTDPTGKVVKRTGNHTTIFRGPK